MEQTTSPVRSFFRGWRLWLLLAVVAYTLIGFFVLPWIIERQIEKFGQNRLERSLTVEQVRFNPYSLSLAVEGLKRASEQADVGPLVALDALLRPSKHALGAIDAEDAASGALRWHQLVEAEPRATAGVEDMVPRLQLETLASEDAMLPVKVLQGAIVETREDVVPTHRTPIR